MARAIYIACVFALLLAMGLCPSHTAEGAFAPQFSKAGDGVRLISFQVVTPRPSRLGDVATIEFTLRNDANHTITFDKKFGIFVGARWKTPAHRKLNRDFGYSHQGHRLKPGETVSVRIRKILDMPGTWLFWPGYRLGGRWGRLDYFGKRLLVHY